MAVFLVRSTLRRLIAGQIIDCVPEVTGTEAHLEPDVGEAARASRLRERARRADRESGG